METSRREFIGVGAGLVATSLATEAQAGETPADSQGTSAPDSLDRGFVSSVGRGFSSDTVHAGEDSGCAATPIYMGSTNNDGVYTRDHNPTSDALEEKLRELEGGAYAVSTSCGMAAISQTLFTFLRAGARIVRHRCVYAGTYWLFEEDLPRYGVDCVVVDMRDLNQLEDALRKQTDVVFFEVHANPNLDVVDVRRVVDLAHGSGAMVIIDNTFLSPYLLQPLRMGADAVIHSATKYISGHGMGLGGIVVTADRQAGERIKHTRIKHGGVMSPMNAFLLLEGVKTLPLRMERHCTNASVLASYLQKHPKVERVHYPGLAGYEGYEVARNQVRGFGGMLGFKFSARLDVGACTAFTRSLRMCKPWGSLGDASTLALITGAHQGLAIPDSYIRISAGIENAADIVADFEQALDQTPS